MAIEFLGRRMLENVGKDVDELINEKNETFCKGKEKETNFQESQKQTFL